MATIDPDTPAVMDYADRVLWAAEQLASAQDLPRRETIKLSSRDVVVTIRRVPRRTED